MSVKLMGEEKLLLKIPNYCGNKRSQEIDSGNWDPLLSELGLGLSQLKVIVPWGLFCGMCKIS